MTICVTCGNEFKPDKPTRKYCSRECYHQQPVWNKGKTGLQEAWNKQNITHTCEYCGKEYKTVKSLIGITKFCSRTCQNRWLAKNKNVSGSKHYAYVDGSSAGHYRREAFKIHGEFCNRCKSTSNLLVHHIDQNRKNNPVDGSNWEVLCRKCHQLHHNCFENLPVKKSKKNELGIENYRRIYIYKCENCGSDFHPTHKKQKFCSRSCSNKNRSKKV
jgi:hypothetical protein